MEHEQWVVTWKGDKNRWFTELSLQIYILDMESKEVTLNEHANFPKQKTRYISRRQVGGHYQLILWPQVAWMFDGVMCTFDPNTISISPSQCFQRVPTALIEKLGADSIGFVAKPWCGTSSHNLIARTLHQSIRMCSQWYIFCQTCSLLSMLLQQVLSIFFEHT